MSSGTDIVYALYVIAFILGLLFIELMQIRKAVTELGRGKHD